jgi:hypothetical protein
MYTLHYGSELYLNEVAEECPVLVEDDLKKILLFLFWS